MALNILTERTSLPLCSFQGSRRRTGTSAGAVAAGAQRGPEAADRPATLTRSGRTGASFKTEQREAARARPGRTETGASAVDVDF